jgi:hypothetical protein
VIPFGKGPQRPTDNIEEADENHKEVLVHLEELQAKFKAEWEYLQSDEYKAQVRQEIVSRANEPITPPWEE